MIKYLSKKVAAYAAKDDESADIEVLAYGYELFLQEACVNLIALILALPFGLVLPVLVSIVSYILLRRQAGGIHAKYRIVCIITSVFIMYAPALLFTKVALRVPLPVLVLLFACDMLLLYRYAPADTDTRPIRNSDMRRRMRRTAMTTLTVFAAIAIPLSFWWPGYASLLLVVPTIACCFTHPLMYKLFGCEHSSEPVAAN